VNTERADHVPPGTVGVVVIGRNEGERLRRCLTSAVREARHLLYVDSGSSDGSVALAQSLGVETFALDPGMPFSAARARNEGQAQLSFSTPMRMSRSPWAGCARSGPKFPYSTR